MKYTVNVSKDGTDASIGVERDGQPAAVLAHVTPYCGDVWKDDAEKIAAAKQLVLLANSFELAVPELRDGEKAIQTLQIHGFTQDENGKWRTGDFYRALQAIDVKASPFAPAPPGWIDAQVSLGDVRVLAQDEIDRLAAIIANQRERIAELERK